MASKIAIVTGSSSGVGKETATELRSKGFHVVFACRNKDKTDAVIAEIAMKLRIEPTDGMTFIQLDTGKMASVKSFAGEFLKKFSTLDVLVHNAGSGYFLSKDRVTEDGLEAFFQTNYLGPFLLTKLLLDTLKKSNGRVLCLSSIEHWDGSYNFDKAVQKTTPASYPTSKLMMMLHAFELRERHNITALAVNPGGVMSNIWWYMRGWKKIVWDTLASCVLLTTKQGAQTSVWAATQDATQLPDGPLYVSPYSQWSTCPKRSDTVNRFGGAQLGTTDPRALNKQRWAQLWEFSEEKVKPFL